MYKPLNLINDTNLPSESKLPFLLKLYVNRLNRKWQRSGHSFTWNDYYEIHETYWKQRNSKIVYEKFSSKETNKILQCAKEMEVSVNSYIATAFLKANSDNGTIGMAVDARVDHNRSMSNQATGISVDYTYSRKLSFAENARIVHQKVQGKLRNPVMKYFILRFIELFSPTLIDSILLHTYDLYQNQVTHKLAKIMGYKGKKTRELGITNLTRLDIPNIYGSYGINEALFIPPVVSYAKHIIGVSTLEDIMMITYHFMSEQNEIEELAFFKSAIQNIKHNEVCI